MTGEEYRNEFIQLLDIYKDSNMALNKNLVTLMSKYIAELEEKLAVEIRDNVYLLREIKDSK